MINIYSYFQTCFNDVGRKKRTLLEQCKIGGLLRVCTWKRKKKKKKKEKEWRVVLWIRNLKVVGGSIEI